MDKRQQDNLARIAAATVATNEAIQTIANAFKLLLRLFGILLFNDLIFAVAIVYIYWNFLQA